MEKLSSLQQLHYASNRYALLLIFQGMDGAGKDGAIRHVMSGVNPEGCDHLPERRRSSLKGASMETDQQPGWGSSHCTSMNTKLTVVLALFAGFSGGFASRYFEPAPVFAQEPAVPQEIRAQKFIVVEKTGVACGVFGTEEDGTPQIEILGYKGHVYAIVFRSWSMVHGLMDESASHGPKKPTLLPIKP
jgi:hypothetical protein